MKNSELGKAVYKWAKRNNMTMTDAKWKELDREERKWWRDWALDLRVALEDAGSEHAGDLWEEFDGLEAGLRGKL